jgi:hypothetical protein
MYWNYFNFFKIIFIFLCSIGLLEWFNLLSFLFGSEIIEKETSFIILILILSGFCLVYFILNFIYLF